MKRNGLGFIGAWCLLLGPACLAADSYVAPPAPLLGPGNLANGQVRWSFSPYPSADSFVMWSQEAPGAPWLADGGGVFSNLTWSTPASGAQRFHRLEVRPLSSNAVVTAIALNRLAYGPTPDLLDRLATIGPGAWIDEQLHPESVVERATTAHTNIAFIQSRFGTAADMIVSSARTNAGPGTAAMLELQAWLVLNAVFADRQLLEVLTQFWENHFVTYGSKSADFFGGAQFRDGYPQRAAAELEWREVTRWRQILLNPAGTFYDLLRVSAESPAMLIYLDTATSRGNPPNIPNENYSRELMELFCMGVDNGYDQTDITNMAPCWTGWTLELVTAANAFNPFAPRSNIRIDPAGPNAFTNLVGVWAMNFKPNVHAPSAKQIFGGKRVPERFGAPYTTKTYGANAAPGLYELNIPARTGTNGFADGYDVVRHLANLPFTQEHIAVKLCRLLVHDDFATGYNFTEPNLSAEGRLVKECMSAWEASGGQLRPVLAAIVNSELFRSQGAYGHKVKTPLEFAASAVRALRQSANGTGTHGTWTSFTDGYGVVSSQGSGNRGGADAALLRMGNMSLFNREEPDGYPEAGSGWASAGAWSERVRFISSLLKAVGQTGKNDNNLLLNNNVTDPVRLLQLRMPNAQSQRDAGLVTDVFLSLLFPGEGRASLDNYRNLAVSFLNTADDGTSASSFAELTPANTAGSPYDTRVRGMVALLLSLPRFQEQ